MKLLLDECVPTQLRHLLKEHHVHSVRWAGFSGIKNGHLLAAAQNDYDVLLTVDRNLMHQNKVAKFTIGVIVIASAENSMEQLAPKIDLIREALKQIKPGQVIVVGETESGL